MQVDASQMMFDELLSRDIFEGDDLHIPAKDQSAIVTNLYNRRLLKNMRGGDFDRPIVYRVAGYVEQSDIMLRHARIYVHGEPAQAHYRWVEYQRVIERLLFGVGPHPERGLRTLYVRIGETSLFAEEMLYGEEVPLCGKRERRMVVNVLNVALVTAV